MNVFFFILPYIWNTLLYSVCIPPSNSHVQNVLELSTDCIYDTTKNDSGFQQPWT